MIYKKIFLKDLTNINITHDSFIEIFSDEKNLELNIDPRPVMIVCPGGGYAYCSRREAEPIVFRFLSEGFNCVLLNYSTKVKYPIPQLELALTFNFIKNNCEEFNMNPNYISAVGFSAGGHLIASYSLYYKEYAKMLDLKEEIIRPFSLVLAYPVISKIFASGFGSFNNLSQGDTALFDKFDIVDNITSNFPPTYIWTTKKDGYINPENSTLLVEQFKKLNIKHKFSLFEEGLHGGSLFNHSVYDMNFDFKKVRENKKWVDEAVDFIFNLIEEER